MMVVHDEYKNCYEDSEEEKKIKTVTQEGISRNILDPLQKQRLTREKQTALLKFILRDPTVSRQPLTDAYSYQQ